MEALAALDPQPHGYVLRSCSLGPLAEDGKKPISRPKRNEAVMCDVRAMEAELAEGAQP